MEFNWNKFKENAVKYFKGIRSIALIVISMAIGAWGYKAVIEIQNVKSYQHTTNTIQETSVAVNERAELVIFNRVTGDYVVYDKDVCVAIFNLQFEKIQANFKSKEPIKQ